MDVFLRIGDKTFGPLTPAQVRRKYERGGIPTEASLEVEGISRAIPASEIPNLQEFRWATEDQKAALRFLGQAVPRGLMYPQAELLIGRMAAELDQLKELELWKARLKKMKEVRTWWQQQVEIGIPGGIVALEEEVVRLQQIEPELFEKISPVEIARRIPHFARDAWRLEPATEPQLNVLSSRDLPITPNLTKGEASDLIDRLLNQVSEGQLRRLKFFRLPAHATKAQASLAIDRHLEQYPEAEAEYQSWKTQSERSEPPAGMTLAEWQKILSWASQQSITMTFVLSDPLVNDQAASPRQLDYIRKQVTSIDEAKLETLTKTQATNLITEIAKEKQIFLKAKVQQFLEEKGEAQ